MFAVKYNGGNKSYFGCSDPDKLVRDQIYEHICTSMQLSGGFAQPSRNFKNL